MSHSHSRTDIRVVSFGHRTHQISQDLDLDHDHSQSSNSNLKRLEGLVFVIDGGISEEETAQMSAWIHSHGGIVSSEYGAQCTHLVTRYIDECDSYEAAKDAGVSIVSPFWIEACKAIFMNQNQGQSPAHRRGADSSSSHAISIPRPQDRVLYAPLPTSGGIKPLKQCIISVTNFRRFEKKYVKALIEAVGAIHTGECSAQNTHLIVGIPKGDKHKMAGEWGLKKVNIHWLEDCISAWNAVPEDSYDVYGAAMEDNLYTEKRKSVVDLHRLEVKEEEMEEEEEEEIKVPEKQKPKPHPKPKAQGSSSNQNAKGKGKGHSQCPICMKMVSGRDKIMNRHIESGCTKYLCKVKEEEREEVKEEEREEKEVEEEEEKEEEEKVEEEKEEEGSIPQDMSHSVNVSVSDSLKDHLMTRFGELVEKEMEEGEGEGEGESSVQVQVQQARKRKRSDTVEKSKGPTKQEREREEEERGGHTALQDQDPKPDMDSTLTVTCPLCNKAIFVPFQKQKGKGKGKGKGKRRRVGSEGEGEGVGVSDELDTLMNRHIESGCLFGVVKEEEEEEKEEMEEEEEVLSKDVMFQFSGPSDVTRVWNEIAKSFAALTPTHTHSPTHSHSVTIASPNTYTHTYNPHATHNVFWKVARTEKLLCVIASGGYVLHAGFMEALGEMVKEKAKEKEKEKGKGKGLLLPSCEQFDWSAITIERRSSIVYNKHKKQKVKVQEREKKHENDIEEDDDEHGHELELELELVSSLVWLPSITRSRNYVKKHGKRVFSDKKFILIGPTQPPVSSLTRILSAGDGTVVSWSSFCRLCRSGEGDGEDEGRFRDYVAICGSDIDIENVDSNAKAKKCMDNGICVVKEMYLLDFLTLADVDINKYIVGGDPGTLLTYDTEFDD